jgi:hypothetical protein
MRFILIMVLNLNIYPAMWSEFMVRIAIAPMLFDFFISLGLFLSSILSEASHDPFRDFDVKQWFVFCFDAIPLILIGVIVGEILARDFEQDIEDCSIKSNPGQTPEQQVAELKTIATKCLKK